MEKIFPLRLVKQENRENSPPSIMHERQVNVPLSMHHSPPNQLPLISPPTQEDLWHLPGQLRINPSLWNKEDVGHWLHWAQKEYSLRRPERGHFEMNGRALCLLTKEDFRRRCPNSGDVLYEILQCVKQQRRSVVCDPPNSSPSVETGPIQNQVSCQIPTQSVQEPQPPAVNDVQDGSVAVSPLLHNQVHCLPQTASVIQEPLNLSSREKPKSPMHKANGRIPEYIRWEDRNNLVFRVVDPNGLARLWGNHKNRDNMTYEKMSRALRHYYKLNIIKKERGQKLLFRFLKLPQNNKKSQVVESQEYTPPQDRDFSDSGPTHEFCEDHFEVSPDPASPQHPP
ncbi:transcription factor ETV7 isoform X2 [Cyclopterus lumpus]|uniref:transcription factor ETV7 isoform X2 n=1 Tax=Cyclopterus lumpus TaxID=8103 RepID=UPI00148622E1|nr:transcription factor ETV7 isoform X2 [Cyclopterus lumpus]